MRITAIVIGLIALALAGCTSTSPPERFYTLAADAQAPGAQPTTSAAYTIAVGPVTVPEIVDRPQLVLRTAPNRVMIAEQARWAEPLKSGIPRVIADNLAQLMADARISTYAQRVVSNPDYRVLIDIQRFDSALGDAVTIEALWTVRGTAGTPQTGRTLAREPAGGSYDTLVAAHSKALAAVSRDIAAAIASARSAAR